MEDRISRFVSGWFKTLILKPGSSVSTNHRTTKALPEGNLFGSYRGQNTLAIGYDVSKAEITTAQHFSLAFKCHTARRLLTTEGRQATITPIAGWKPLAFSVTVLLKTELALDKCVQLFFITFCEN